MLYRLKSLIIISAVVLFIIIIVKLIFAFTTYEDIKNMFPNTSDQPDLIISNAEELVDFSNNINNGDNFKGRRVILKNDIVFDINTKNNFTPIGDDAKITASSGGFITNKVAKKYEFSGTFDGEGHTISGVNIKRVSVAVVKGGLFSTVSKYGVVKNVTIKDSIIKGNTSVGGIVALNKGKIENCSTVNCDTKNVDSGTVGGIVGENNGVVENCLNYSNIEMTQVKAGRFGGIVGYNNNLVDKSINYGTISGFFEEEADKYLYSGVGGIVGANTKKISNCINYGGVNFNKYYGSIVGYNSTGSEYFYEGKPKPNIINCHYLEGTSEEGVGKNDKPANTDIHMFKEGEINLDEILEKYK